MGKIKAHAPKLNKKYYPFVSVCTPTFNRRPFIPTMLDCFRNQTYPKDRMEWIIVDDGTDRIKDLIDAANIPQIRYLQPPKKLNLGEKRNFMHSHAKGSIIVYMDDDDYYPPERVSHAVEMLSTHKDALCAGSSEMYIYFKHIGKMIQCGPYGPNHATAGTFAFRSSLLDQTKYEDHAALAEERAFLKNYTVPFVQLDPLKTILVFSHIHNTFDKKKLLENAHPDFLKESTKTVDMFIAGAKEAHIKKFFMEDIDELLAKYEPGEPKMKPEVLEQTKKMEEERRQAAAKYMQEQGQGGPNDGPTIMLQQDGKPPVPLSMQQIAELLQSQQNENDALKRKVAELEGIILELQRIQMTNRPLPSNNEGAKGAEPKMIPEVFVERSKTEPEIRVDL